MTGGDGDGKWAGPWWEGGFGFTAQPPATEGERGSKLGVPPSFAGVADSAVLLNDAACMCPTIVSGEYVGFVAASGWEEVKAGDVVFVLYSGSDEALRRGGFGPEHPGIGRVGYVGENEAHITHDNPLYAMAGTGSLWLPRAEARVVAKAVWVATREEDATATVSMLWPEARYDRLVPPEMFLADGLRAVLRGDSAEWRGCVGGEVAYRFDSPEHPSAEWEVLLRVESAEGPPCTTVFGVERQESGGWSWFAGRSWENE